jgi:hypothetical protein
MSTFDNLRGNAGDLLRRLSKPQDDFSETLSNRTMVIDPGEAKIFKRSIAELREQTFVCVICRDATFTYGIEQRSKLGWCHDAIRRALTLPDPTI